MNPLAWALGWLVTSYVIIANVEEQFAVFGASGAIVFGVLTWLQCCSGGRHPRST